MGIHDIWLFVLAGLLLNVTPGPDMALVIARSTQVGSRAGMAAALGIGAGTFVHIAAAAVGISAVIMASATAFGLIKWLGAMYLVYIGLQIVRGTFSGATAPEPALVAPLRTGFWVVFLQGFLTNAFNPKVAVFFLAFLPQFIDADAPSKVQAFVVLGLLFAVTGTAWNLAVARLAGQLGAQPAFGRVKVWLERGIGVLFVGAGCKIALAERL